MAIKNVPDAPDDEDVTGVETEYVTASGVSKQPLQLEQVPAGVKSAHVVWTGEKRANRPGSVLSYHQGQHTDVIVPDDRDPGITTGTNAQLPIHTQGTSYHFVRDVPTRVAEEHVDALLNDPIRTFERHTPKR